MIFFSLVPQSSLHGVRETPGRLPQACQENAWRALPDSGKPVEPVGASPPDAPAAAAAPASEESALPMEKAEKAQSHFLRARIRHGFSWCLVALFLFGVYTFLSLFRWMDWGVREKAYLLRQAFSGPQWESFYFPYGIEADAGAPARRASRGPPVLSAVFEVKISAARRYELRFLVPDDPAHRSDRGWVIACPLRPDAGGGGFIRDAANERTYSAAATLQQIHIDMLYYFSQNAPS